MNKLNRIIKGSKKPTIDELISSIKNIKFIENFYKIIKKEDESNKSLENIENKLQVVYKEFYNKDSDKSEFLKRTYNELLNYNNTLFKNSRGKSLIETKISKFETKTKNFYDLLFDESNSENINTKTSNLATEFIAFYDKFIKPKYYSFNTILNEFYKQFVGKYRDLLEANKGEKSKIETLSENIDEINDSAKEIEEYKESIKNQ